MRDSGVHIPDFAEQAGSRHTQASEHISLTDRPDDPDVEKVFDKVLDIIRDAELKDRQVVELLTCVLGRSVIERAVRRGAAPGSEAMIDTVRGASMPGCFAAWAVIMMSRGKAFPLTASIHHFLVDLVAFGKENRK
jgi:hypothetical protein